MAPGPAAGREVRTVPRWIGAPGRQLMSWVSEPAGAAAAGGVLLAPPIGYEYSSSHRSMRALAEALARRGWRAVRVDYDGTGDSAGDQWDPDRLERWGESIALGVAELRSAGAAPITVVGVHLGATLALLGAAGGRRLVVDRLALWDPVSSGRALARATRLLGEPVPPGAGPVGAVTRAGTAYRSDTLEALGALDATRIEVAPAGDVLVVDRAERPAAGALVARLRQLGSRVEHLPVPGTGAAMDQPAEYAVVAASAIDAVTGWAASPPADAPRLPAATARPATNLSHRGRALGEEVVSLGPSGLTGVLTTPGSPPAATVVWLNAGSEPHAGPGRAWVEYGRTLAAAGYASVRLDFSGWGDSPDLGHAPGRPYDAHGVGEALAAASALRQAGHRRVVLAGVCAGAWVALRGALAGTVDGVVAVNPQLYWQPGDPVEADITTETHVRREDEIDRDEWGAGVGLWAAQERLGIAPAASGWLDALAASGVPCLFAFSDGDDGLAFLRHRVGPAWGRALASGVVEEVVVAGIDHAMHRLWRRPALIGEVEGWLRRQPAGAGVRPGRGSSAAATTPASAR